MKSFESLELFNQKFYLASYEILFEEQFVKKFRLKFVSHHPIG